MKTLKNVWFKFYGFCANGYNKTAFAINGGKSIMPSEMRGF